MTEPTILGIETSCDETAAAVVTGGRQVLSNVVATQFDVHAKYGGIVPELASRAHIENLDGVIQEAMASAGVGRNDLDAIAVTNRPGLMGCLLIGVMSAKTLALTWGKPLLGVNHIHAHAASAAIALPADAPQPWPAVALVVSGGHTSLFLVRDPLSIELLGRTIDDAAGEAFDKVASILNLGFPGGPIVDRVARAGNPSAYDFPRSMLDREALDFSFSGIKTAVLYRVHGPGKKNGSLDHLSEQDIADVAASFQAAVVDVLVGKTLQAVEQTGVKTVVVGGGVAANHALREGLSAACNQRGITLHLTPMKYCGDNGAMVAAMGYYLLKAGRTADLTLEPKATARE
ncbi:MAG TPA: tRNA (adenosine(37)-N6)-threonylcarbamoyltransferase complex transferase subunit TsaD [Phycisphaerae bacterium]|jgi:N6-L-threonylcarbamoyladenine synthase|nr:tRNA (adenosine(37)-N6)-threonylcarbamoyltransferase complex transferase subunit TsaD [Phycisphaerae bacterium]HOJ53665.1 tRNA (adenosine(37)-N6)-threonylcarbamoyltransferase complex transferase subunit TsaD [Phycisphaerae bacterium]HOL26390.1 tRNA (adenosine(37)-N6)-threonylcarbamoyltransferase complex transferase subunit TsaD [Phycisphaerae bacterium]HPP21102.1 tRNA (adenosine(37)-N6)-threonylcarbamoyltransferase complex transferase subunit TsaD [Phycisphaerae bacterium]HPU34657.1 tRNA (ad